jgi:hypothetical protein
VDFDGGDGNSRNGGRSLRVYSTADGESHFDEVEIPTTSRQAHPNECRCIRNVGELRGVRSPAKVLELFLSHDDALRGHDGSTNQSGVVEGVRTRAASNQRLRGLSQTRCAVQF